ncbi:hypothetical protein ACJMK2_042835 [Sinanodonta woodiana]|uniref:VWFA domain-containing protein n=2 Tax=Sinanodonta woodiana TaxID=1069815 RepID=A0ABD3VV18_SINWO
MGINIRAVLLSVLIARSLTAIINGSTCPGKPNDVIFLVDTSRSIWRPHFEAQLRFVLDIIKKFQVGPGENETRIAIATYAQRPWPQFNLRDFYRMQDIDLSVMAIQHMGGYRTNSGAALEFGVQRMLQPTFGARQNSTKAVVLLTDGQSQDNVKAIEVASKAKEQGIIIIVIAVGRGVVLKTLDSIVSSPVRDHLFVREDFMSLNGVSIEVAKRICKSTLTTTAPTMTMSSSTTPVPLRGLQKPKVEKLSESRVVIPTKDGKDVALGSHTDGTIGPSNAVSLSGSGEKAATTRDDQMIRAGQGSVRVESLPTGGGQGLIVERTTQGSRDDGVIKIGELDKTGSEDGTGDRILSVGTPIVDLATRFPPIHQSSRQEQTNGGVTGDQEVSVETPVIDISSRIPMGVQTNREEQSPYVGRGPDIAIPDVILSGPLQGTKDEQGGQVSVKPGTDSENVRTISMGPSEEGAYQPSKYGNTETKHPSGTVEVDWPLPGLRNQSREASDIDPSLIVSNCGGKPADIYFVLDASNSIWPEDFKKQLSFVRDLIHIFDISEDKTRVGVITFSDYVKPEITLESKQDKAVLVERVSNITFLMGRTDTAMALRFVREQGFSPDVARREVAHIMLVFTDGLSKNPRLTAHEAALARKAGIYLFAIGIGESVEREELRDIASDPDDDFVFQVSDFGALNTIKNILAIKTCAIQADATMEDVKGCSIKKPTDVMFVYDSSELGTKKTKLITEFVDHVTKALDMNTGYLRAGRLTENCLSRADVRLTNDQRTLSHERVQFPEFRELMRKLVSSGFQRRNGARTDSKKIAVIFLDDDLSNMREAADEIKRLRDADTFVITIGDVDPVVSQRFNSVPMDDYIVHIPSYKYLNTARTTAIHKLCKILTT